MTTPDEPIWTEQEIEARRNEPNSTRAPLPGVEEISQDPGLFDGDEDGARLLAATAAQGTVAAMLGVARTLLGTTEHPSGSNHNFVTVWYGFDGAWCDMGISYEAGHSGNLAAVGGKFAYTPAHAAWFKAHGLWHNGISGIKPGDVVFFDWGNPGHPRFAGIEHVGLVEKTSGGRAITIECNISDACRREVRDSTYIVGYGRPHYVTAPTEDTLKTVVDLGAEKPQTVKAGQRYSLGYELEYSGGDPGKIHTDADKSGRYPSIFPTGGDAPYAVSAEVVLAGRPDPGVQLVVASYARNANTWERDIRGEELASVRHTLHSNVRMSDQHKYRIDVVNSSQHDVVVERAYLFITH